MKKIKLGDKVICNKTNITGVVIKAGPYGDQPYQVRDENNKVHSFITEYGHCPFGPDSKQCWEKHND